HELARQLPFTQLLDPGHERDPLLFRGEVCRQLGLLDLQLLLPGGAVGVSHHLLLQNRNRLIQ
ncbi:unnamed protein product, partial [Closterium sp. Naga37s-1]